LASVFEAVAKRHGWITFPLAFPADNVSAALGLFGIGAVEPTRDVLYTSVARLVAHVGQESATGALQKIRRTSAVIAPHGQVPREQRL